MKKIDESYTDFWDQYDVVYNPNGTLEYIHRYEDNDVDEPEADQDIPK